MLRPLIALFLLGLLLSGNARAARFDFDTAGGVLPKTVLPRHYTLAFELDPAADTFAGEASIEVEVRQPVAAIVLNAFDLTAGDATLVDAAGQRRPLIVQADAGAQQWRLGWRTRDLLGPGRYTLKLSYRGSVARVGEGLFRVDYTAQGQPARMLATQLQPTRARRVFPAFDEPAFRASFDIAITAPARYEAVSNMPVTAREPQADGRATTRFERTPSMTPYLVALAVGEFDALESSVDGVPLRILTARGKREQARYAMQVTEDTLRRLGAYFGVPYMLPKLDQIAVPGVRGGAMEDWGAISYNEALLLFDPAASAPSTRLWISLLVTHEIAHQWFGNLVTAAWWNDLWLNEAMATFLAARLVDAQNPAWQSRLGERRWIDEVMASDRGSSARSLRPETGSEAAIQDAFDDLTYAKGGDVLRMIEQHVGEERFRDGLRRYLSAHAYGNATADDLWFHLGGAAGAEVEQTLRGWSELPGFPLVTLALDCRAQPRLTLSQRRFGPVTAGQLAAQWHTPLALQTGDGVRRLLLAREPQTIALRRCELPRALAGETGYFRIAYDAGAQAQLLRALPHWPVADRLRAQADAFALARAGLGSAADYLALLARLRSGDDVRLWRQAGNALRWIDVALAGDPLQPALRRFALARIVPMLAALGWQAEADEDIERSRLRAQLIELAAHMEHRPTVERAQALYRQSTGQSAANAPLPAAIREAVLVAVGLNADAATVDALGETLARADTEELRREYVEALSAVREPAAVRRVQALALGDAWRPDISARIAVRAGRDSARPQATYDFVRANFAVLAARSSNWGRAHLLAQAADTLSSESAAAHLVADQRVLLGDDEVPVARRAAEQIRERARFRARAAAELAPLPAL